MKQNVEYAIYRGDEFLFIDTLEKCAERLKISINSVRWLSSPAAISKLDNSKGNRMVAVKLDNKKATDGNQ
ncbi:MAG: hypothetical protein LKF42_09815 [Streptococcaceae bacterium]|jgi:hypothetical protein|nr:hypothetical protein [Streptococcaceae bacterium]